MSVPDYLVIGTITKDVIPGGYTVGGTVTYGAMTAHHLGSRAAIVTSASSDLVYPDDLAAIELSKNVAKTVEENLQYPGQIKVTVIRETRAVDFAK